MEAPVQEGDLLAGKYRVEKVLGFGGMGVVVSAFRGDLEQRVAVKFLSQAAAERPDAAERFRREARAAAKIRSEHVARVLDVGTLDTGLPYMVMEFLEGNDIAEELRRFERLPITDAVEFILQAIEALAEAHAAGVVHRDLKPGNLFLAQRADGSRRVKVLDFGISKALSGSSVEELSLTKTAALIGSPLYMAPEQMRSAKDVDTRADIWSLGAMLYEMLTGQPPYLGESIPQLCAALLHDEPIPLRQHRPEIPEGLEQAVLRCLMKDRNHRFPTVFELGRALLPFAMPDSRIHVERAERVLRVTDATISNLPPMTERNSLAQAQSSMPAISIPITPLAATPAAVMQPIEPTVNSWGQSGMVNPPKRRGALVAIGLIAALIAAIGGLLAARASSSSDAKGPAPAASPSLDAKSELKPAPPPAPPPVEVAPPPTAEPTSVTSEKAGLAAAPPTPPAPVAASLKAKPQALNKSAPKKPDAKPEPAPPPAAKPGGITDFGGRR
ncbi:MAG TPA: serine/threonine-protein kinase [Polyangiaceae bacterium]|nr:serine/threonine-protein kinase [Polyangiaceae bacterium]